eukprot:SAG11_NODE_1029_length_6121_cov_24.347891_2_plen_191_part_00
MQRRAVGGRRDLEFGIAGSRPIRRWPSRFWCAPRPARAHVHLVHTEGARNGALRDIDVRRKCLAWGSISPGIVAVFDAQARLIDYNRQFAVLLVPHRLLLIWLRRRADRLGPSHASSHSPGDTYGATLLMTIHRKSGTKRVNTTDQRANEYDLVSIHRGPSSYQVVGFPSPRSAPPDVIFHAYCHISYIL